MGCYAFAGNSPSIHPTAFVHPAACVTGRVELGPGCFVGPFASLRADWLTIRVGAGSNIQDNCLIHGFPGDEVTLGEDAHLGHGCIVHGARLGRNVMVGMNAVVQDRVVVGDDVIIGSGCVVPMDLEIPPGKLVVGVPGRIVADVRPDLARMKRQGTRWYQELARAMGQGLSAVDLEACRSEDLGPGSAEWQAWLDQLTSTRGAEDQAPEG